MEENKVQDGLTFWVEPGWGASIIDQVEASGCDGMNQVIRNVVVTCVFFIPYFGV